MTSPTTAPAGIWIARINGPDPYDICHVDLFASEDAAADYIEGWQHHQAVGTPRWTPTNEYVDDVRTLAHLSRQTVRS